MKNPLIIGDATFYLGDCLEVMAGLPKNSIDTIITDPPYGLEFMGKKWDYDVPAVEIWKECLRVLKPGGTALIFAGSRTQHRMATNVEDSGFILKDCIMWIYGSGFPKAINISKQLNKKAGAVQTRTGKDSDEAILWNGWKSHGLKPAYEPILVAMKPNAGSYAENALKHGVAGLNVEGARIKGEPIQVNKSFKSGRQAPGFRMKKCKKTVKTQARYPSNIILDEEAAAMLDEQSGNLTSGGFSNGDPIKESDNNCMSGKNYKRKRTQDFIANQGGASRFFYCAKASPAERNNGCDGLPLNEPIYGKNMSSSDKGTISGSVNPTRNNHPTVKPISLMEYLCSLTKTPTGGIVLDPFMGSGTTAIACHRTNRKFIGIEKEKKYFDIAVSRYREEIKQMRLCDLK